MSKSIALRSDFDAGSLRRLARRARDVRQARRLLALACVCDGMSRTEAARAGGMDRQTLRDWVHRFNEEGPDGLLDRKPERGRRLSASQLEDLSRLVEAGPDPDRDGVMRWRRIDLQRLIEARFGVVYHERTVSKLLKALGYSRITGRPQHPGQDVRIIDTFKKTSQPRSQPT